MKKRTLSLLLVFLLVFSCLPGMAAAEERSAVLGAIDATVAFVDMPDDWSSSALRKAVENGLLSGYEEDGVYCIKPSGNITRAELAAVVNRAFGTIKGEDLSGVQDVPAGAWYEHDMAKAVAMGTLVKDQLMRPNDPVTRQEAMVILARALEISGGESALALMSDSGEIAPWARSGIAAMASNGYVTGSFAEGSSLTMIRPLEQMTRAEFAVMMDNVIAVYLVAGETVTGRTFSGNVMIKGPGVTLEDVTVEGDLIIGDGVDEGSVNLSSVNASGRLLIRGGTAESIKIADSAFASLAFGENRSRFDLAGEFELVEEGGAQTPEEAVPPKEPDTQTSSSGRRRGGNSGGETNEKSSEPKAARLTLKSDSFIGEIQIGFLPPEDEQDLAAYMIVYSAQEKAAVWAYAEGLDTDGLAKIVSDNRGKRITNLTYADGTGNSYRSGQKDILTSKEFGPNEIYHFYVLSLSQSGVMGIAEAVDTISTYPFAVTREGGYELENYGVTFLSPQNTGVTDNYIIYSKLGDTLACEAIRDMAATTFRSLPQDGRAVAAGTGGKEDQISVTLTAKLKDLEGKERSENDIYYVYLVSLAGADVVSIVKADRLITPEKGPQALESIGKGPGYGVVMPAGGSTSLNPGSPTYVQEYIDAFKAATDGTVERPRAVVFETSYGVESLGYDYFYNYEDISDIDVLAENGVEAVYIPLGSDNYASITNEPYFADLVKSCHIVLLMGGDQAYHARALLNDDGTLSLVGEAVQYVFEHGGTIAGSSAGGAVMSNPAFQNGVSYETLYWNQTEYFDIGSYNTRVHGEAYGEGEDNSIYYESTGFVQLAAGRPVLLDSHFDARGRFGRLLVALRDTDPRGIAIGMDEGTGIRIEGDTSVGTVVGRRGIFIVDAKDADWGPGGRENAFAVKGLLVHYLTEGDRYNFETGEVLPAENKKAIEEDLQKKPYESAEIFSSYEVSKSILSLIESGEDRVTGKALPPSSGSFAGGPAVEVHLLKTADTIAYTSESPYLNTEVLEGFTKATVTGLQVSVGEGEDSVSEIPEEFAPRDIKFVTKGRNNITEIKLGFHPPVNEQGLSAYLLAYSTCSLEEVWELLRDKTAEEIDTLADQSGLNQGYKITNLSWADGSGNTLRSNQKDLVTGKPYEDLGEYHFYVAALSRGGVLSVAEANESITLYPPLEIDREGGYELENYTLVFTPVTGAAQQLVIYSELGESLAGAAIERLSNDDRKALIEKGWAQSAQPGETDDRSSNVDENGETEKYRIRLSQDLKDLSGNERKDDRAYYLYLLALADDGSVIELMKGDRLITPERGPEALTKIGRGPGTGAVIPAGGSTSLDPKSGSYVQDYIDAFKEATKDTVERPRAVVLDTAYCTSEAECYDYFYNDGDSSEFVVMDKNGIEAVYVPLAIDNYRSITNEPYFADVVKSCEIVVFIGGDQARLARTLLNDDGSLTLIGEAIQYVYEQGGTIAGSSAGAAFMSNPAFQDGNNYSYQAMFWNGTEKTVMAEQTDRKFDLASSKLGNNIAYESTGYIALAAGEDVLIDTHFDNRGRMGRMLVALRDTTPDGLAMGLDEGTGIRVESGIGTVFGQGGVFIVDAFSADWSKAGSEEVFEADGLILHYLTEGDTFDFESRIATAADSKVKLEEAGQAEQKPYLTEDVFGQYEFSKALLAFIASDEAEVSNNVKKASSDTFRKGPDFKVTLRKLESASVYMSGERYEGGSSGTHLGNHYRSTAIALGLAVQIQGTAEELTLFLEPDEEAALLVPEDESEMVVRTEADEEGQVIGERDDKTEPGQKSESEVSEHEAEEQEQEEENAGQREGQGLSQEFN